MSCAVVQDLASRLVWECRVLASVAPSSTQCSTHYLLLHTTSRCTNYCIVLGKCPWALAAQAPKIEGGCLHAWMVQLSLHHRWEVSCQGGTELTCIITSSMLRQGQPDSRESCIVLKSRLICILIAKLPQCSSLAVWEFCATSDKQSEAWWSVHHNDCCYVREFSGPTFGSICNIFCRVGSYTEKIKKKKTHQITTNWGVGACTGMGASPLRTVKAAYLHMNCTPMTCMHGEFNC